MPDALRFLILAAAGWVNRHQEDVIDYLREENRVLREQRGPRPLRLTDAQRRRLAVRGQKLGRRILAQVAGAPRRTSQLLLPRGRTRGWLIICTLRGFGTSGRSRPHVCAGPADDANRQDPHLPMRERGGTPAA